MAARFVLRTFPKRFADRLGVTVADYFDPASTPRFNIAPMQPIVVAARAAALGARGDKRTLIPMLWGLIPHWSKEMPTSGGWFNARGETAFDKPSFRSAAKYRRCLVPADGYYQWRTSAGGKLPYLYERSDGEPFCFAAIWDHWTAPDGSERQGVAVLTVGSESDAGDRSPVILDESAWDDWTHTEPERVMTLKKLIRAAPDGLLTSRRVSQIVNNVRNDSPECVLSPD